MRKIARWAAFDYYHTTGLRPQRNKAAGKPRKVTYQGAPRQTRRRQSRDWPEYASFLSSMFEACGVEEKVSSFAQKGIDAWKDDYAAWRERLHRCVVSVKE